MMFRRFIPPKRHSGFRRRSFPPRRRNMGHYVVGHDESLKQKSESREESILTFLGIACTVLNLLVMVFVYIYTSLSL
ncbi:uncharacterized protein LOC113647981 isoform X3 [Tachysurus fulvidraco]|uniref:uncharacterized protein LOC113647981 isoform X3 n=1 Tax=Tachysurus fulvidraco TaxID=1234273 RepID=UPI001FEF2200|nr:uncharacterized protein LOC113647981 isoform X3 [Tachysurus fulvidraco]